MKPPLLHLTTYIMNSRIEPHQYVMPNGASPCPWPATSYVVDACATLILLVFGSLIKLEVNECIIEGV